MTKYNFTKVTTRGAWEVSIDPEAQYGCFEHDIEGGGADFGLKTTALLTTTACLSYPRRSSNVSENWASSLQRTTSDV